MSSHHAGSRFAGPPWRLAAVLLSGVFVLITGAVPASATPAESSTDASVEADADQAGPAIDVVGAHDRPDAALGATYPGNDTDAPPPPSSYTDVAPLDRVALQPGPASAEHLLRERPGSASDPDRGPPADEQLPAKNAHPARATRS